MGLDLMLLKSQLPHLPSGYSAYYFFKVGFKNFLHSNQILMAIRKLSEK
jgi:hypothetical protein